jgi:hypothetical protein
VVLNQTAALQLKSCCGNANAPNTKHVGQKIVRDVKRIGARSILAHQEPTRQAWTNLMEVATCRGSGKLPHQYINVLAQSSLKRQVDHQFLFEYGNAHAQR